MRRREFIKAALAATVTPGVLVAQNSVTPAVKATTVAPGPLPWMKGLDHVDMASVRTASIEDLAMAEPSFFSVEQMATLKRLSAVLMPPLNRRPGAIDAQTPEFLDFLIGKAADDVQHTYKAGLDGLEAESKRKYGKSFATLEAAQADAILKPRMASWMPEHYPEGPERRFVAMAHHDIREATRNSEAWAKADGHRGEHPEWAELYWFPVDGEIA